jgi:hypothetical protein
MNLLETTTHSFVIKIWQEEPAAESGRGKWRGRITHVGTGAHGYFEDLAEIPRFVAPYLGYAAYEQDRTRRLWHRLRAYFSGR